MSYQALYRKWRPMTFDEVVGQDPITTTLKNEIASSTVKHAYLFCGTRGTGKTSIAKILARAVNCQHRVDSNPCNACETCRGILDGSILDVIEFDAASNSKVEDIRAILEEVNYSSAKTAYKVYIIDEVHMLSNSAFNALLKTLEEPPSHVIFILATTEVQKLPQTIISRCQRFDFKRISKRELSARFFDILKAENISCDEPTMDYVCTAADGSVRDGLSILDKVIAACPGDITYEKACHALNIASFAHKEQLATAIYEQNIGHILDVLDTMNRSGVSREGFLNNMVSYFRDLLLVNSAQDAGAILEYPKERMDALQEMGKHFSVDHLLYAVSILSQTLVDIRYTKNSNALCEVAFIKIARADLDRSDEALLARLSIVEEKIKHMKSVSESDKPVYTPAVAIATEPKTTWEDSVPDQENSSPVFAPEEKPSTVAKTPIKSPDKLSVKEKKKLPEKMESKKKGLTVSLDAALDWTGFLSSIKKEQASMYGLLSESKGYLTTDHTLYIVFRDEDSFLKMVVSTPQNVETLTKLMQDKLGVSVSVRTELFSDFSQLEIAAEQINAAPQAVSEPKVREPFEETLSVPPREEYGEEPPSDPAPIPIEEIPFAVEEPSLSAEDKLKDRKSVV